MFIVTNTGFNNGDPNCESCPQRVFIILTSLPTFSRRAPEPPVGPYTVVVVVEQTGCR